MIMERVRSALMELERRGAVEKVLSLVEVITNPDLAIDPDYRRTFNGYYKMRQKRDAFYRHFFSMLRDSAYAPPPPSLETILQNLYANTGERHFLFAQKCWRRSLTISSFSTGM